MPEIIIGSTVVDFPDSAESANWAPAIIQFAEAVAEQLDLVSGTFDVAPQTYNIDAFNTATNENIPTLSFSTSSVRAVFIQYYVYRSTSSANADEAGDMIAVFNANNGSGLKWTLTQGNRTGPGANISFNVTDSGQFQFTTTALAGSSHTGRIGFVARALEQT